MNQFDTKYHYTDRSSKAKYVWLKYRPLLQGRLLDVGADKCHLRELLSAGTEYWGIGLGDNLDQVIDLERRSIPFDDQTFDCVLCLDVLEHLDNIHQVFDELCRVSRRYVIISLPNPWASFASQLIFGGEKERLLKFYGLPLEVPADRHKWFFSNEEACAFIQYRAAKNGMQILQIDNYRHRNRPNPGRWLLLKLAGPIFQWRSGSDLNSLFAGPVWAVLERKAATDEASLAKGY